MMKIGAFLRFVIVFFLLFNTAPFFGAKPALDSQGQKPVEVPSCDDGVLVTSPTGEKVCRPVQKCPEEGYIVTADNTVIQCSYIKPSESEGKSKPKVGTNEPEVEIPEEELDEFVREITGDPKGKGLLPYKAQKYPEFSFKAFLRHFLKVYWKPFVLTLLKIGLQCLFFCYFITFQIPLSVLTVILSHVLNQFLFYPNDNIFVHIANWFKRLGPTIIDKILVILMALGIRVKDFVAAKLGFVFDYLWDMYERAQQVAH